MSLMQLAGRFEYKYYVPYESLETLRQRFLKGLEYDSFARKMTQRRYTVRSIYLDSLDFKFYNEKIQGLRRRKKLRIRTYNQIDHTAFLEIKHKIDSVIYKERILINPKELPLFWEGEKPGLISDNPDFADPASLDRFAYLISRYALEPKVLIAYEREALQGLDDERLRVTFDLNVRSYPFPTLEEIFREDDLVSINDKCFVLEIKFNEFMPDWVRRIAHDFDLRRESISKYCEGLDACYFKADGRGWNR